MAQTYVTLPSPKVPREQLGNAIFGTLGHLGSPFFYVVLLGVVAGLAAKKCSMTGHGPRSPRLRSTLPTR